MLNWKTSKRDSELIEQAVARALEIMPHLDRVAVGMDLTACHANGTPLDLEKLLAFPDADFLHDLGGISRHMDKKTGRLGDCFVPRCAA